jgi:5-methylcytosine-specific restriction endonuclease McrA
VNIWRLIAHHEDCEEAIELMKNTNRLAIGWSDIGSLDNFKSKDDIAKAIREHYPTLGNSHTGGPSLWNFKEIQIGDLVIVNVNHKRDSVFEVIDNYEYVISKKSLLGYQHQRKAILRDINAEELWKSVGGNIIQGENIRWSLVKCLKTKKTENILYEEGIIHSVLSSQVERNIFARQACIEYYGYKCQICSFDFVDKYGELGKNFIHVHHIEDISLKGGEYTVNPKKDLIPVCPNCHAMLHKQRPAMMPDELKRIMVQK